MKNPLTLVGYKGCLLCCLLDQSDVIITHLRSTVEKNIQPLKHASILSMVKVGNWILSYLNYHLLLFDVLFVSYCLASDSQYTAKG